MHSLLLNSFPGFFSRIVYWELKQIFPLIGKLLFSGQIATGQARGTLTHLIKTNFAIPEVVLLNSGSSAIIVALEAFKQLNPSRKTVILPIYICPSVISSVKKAGLIPGFAPVGKDLNVTPEDLQKALTNDVLAAIVPHLYGYPANIVECIDQIKQVDPSIFVIDDAAAAFDPSAGCQKLGTWGDVGIFSFNSAKKLTATGGGALIVSNPSLLPLLQEQRRSLPEPSTKEVLAKFMYFWWNFACYQYSPTLNYWASRCLPARPPVARANRMTHLSNLDAALILWLLQRQAPIHERRNQIIRYYMQALKNCPGVLFPQDQADTFSVSRFYMRVAGLTAIRDANGALRQENPLVAYLKQHGIRAGYGYAISDEMLDPDGHQLRRERFAWLDELIWLPVDHKQDVQCYEKVIHAIHMFFETR